MHSMYLLGTVESKAVLNDRFLLAQVTELRCELRPISHPFLLVCPEIRSRSLADQNRLW
jgi:hypothetical protein